MSPSVSTGALALVGSTVAKVVIAVNFECFCGIYAGVSVSEELNESENDEGEEGGSGWDR